MVYNTMLQHNIMMQVRGFCEDKSNPEVFDDVNVYGNMYDSDIHHLRFGLYTYGEHRSIAASYIRLCASANASFGRLCNVRDINP